MTADIGERLKHFRLTLKLTQSDIGYIIGKSTPTVQRYEAGTRNINKFIISVLQEKLGLNPNWLYTGEGNMTMTEINDNAVPVYAYSYKKIINKENAGYFNLDTNARPFRSLNHTELFITKTTENFHPILYGDYLIVERIPKYRGDGLYLCGINNNLKIAEINRDDTKNTITVYCDDVFYSANEQETSIIGKILWMFRNLAL